MLDNTLLKELVKKIRLNKFNREWKKNYKNSQIIPMNVFNTKLFDIGNESYGELNVITFNSNSKLKIGSYCSIAQNVTFLLDVEHHLKYISTYPYNAKIFGKGDEAFSKGDIVIDDDVWIGYGATIMSGVHRGQGAVVAASAVVTKDVPSYAIVAGVPAKVIKYRFSGEMIKELLKVDFSKLSKDMIKEHLDDLYKELTDVKQLDWMPKK